MSLETELASANSVAYNVIDSSTRKIDVDASYRMLGVESDEKTKRVWFKCPKIVDDNINLSTLNLYINYQNGNSAKNVYAVDDMTVSGDNIIFSWLLSRHVTAYKGTVSYIVCAKKSVSGSTVNEWNTRVATGEVVEGLEATAAVVSQNADVIEQILTSLNSKVSQTALTTAVTTALTNAKNSGDFKGDKGDTGAAFTYSDFTAEQLAALKGADGANGQNGLTPTIGDNGNWYIGTTDTGKPSRGVAGADGQNGSDAEVADWAKQPNKPSYTAAEVGALPDTTVVPHIFEITYTDKPEDSIDKTYAEIAEAVDSNDIFVFIDDKGARHPCVVDLSTGRLDNSNESTSFASIVAYTSELRVFSVIITEDGTLTCGYADIITDETITSIIDDEVEEDSENLITSGAVYAAIPTKTSDLTNDSGFLTDHDTFRIECTVSNNAYVLPSDLTIQSVASAVESGKTPILYLPHMDNSNDGGETYIGNYVLSNTSGSYMNFATPTGTYTIAGNPLSIWFSANEAVRSVNGTVLSDNADYAEILTWCDENTDDENRLCKFVALDADTPGNTIKIANQSSDVIGVTVESPAFAGNAADKFDSEGDLLAQYAFVAVHGIVPVIDNGTCTVKGRCMPSSDGTAVPSNNNLGYFCLERVDANKMLIVVEPNSDMLNRIKNDVVSIRNGKADKPTKVTTGTDITLADNTEYRLTDVTELTLAYPTGNFECWMHITTGETAPTITLPTSSYIGKAPTFGASETWELSIKDGTVVAQKVGDGV